MIPSSVDIGAAWRVLPPDIHDADLAEVEERFATTSWRERLLGGFREGCESLKSAGCGTVLLNGSFVTDKPEPGDFDACWDPANVEVGKLDPVLLDFDDARAAQKAKFGGEFFPSSVKADATQTFAEYFQVDKETGKSKGIVRIKL